MADFTSDPRFQKARRRRLNVDPSQQAIIDTRDIGAAFAAEEELGRIRGGARASVKDIRTRGFEEDVRSRKASEALGQERLDFAREDIDFQRGQTGIANIIRGVGLGANVLGGIGALREADRRVSFLEEQISAFKNQGRLVEAEELERLLLLENRENF